MSEEPAPIEDLLALLSETVTEPGLNPASAGHLGYIPGGGVYAAALGDYLADVTNEYAGVSFAGPGAVKMENMMLEWMAAVVGYPPGCGGNLPGNWFWQGKLEMPFLLLMESGLGSITKS